MDAEEFFGDRYEMLILYLNEGDGKRAIDNKTLDKFASEVMTAINDFLKLGQERYNGDHKLKLYNRIKKIAERYAPGQPQYQSDYKRVEDKADVGWFDDTMESFEKMNRVSPSNVDVFTSHMLISVNDEYRVFYTDEEKEQMRQESIERVAKIYRFDPTGILKAFNNGIQGHALIKMGADPDFVKFWFGEPYTDEDIAKLDEMEKEKAKNIVKNMLPYVQDYELDKMVPVKRDNTRVGNNKRIMLR